MARDTSGETKLSLIPRATASMSVRVRGGVLANLRFFSNRPKNLSIAKGLKLLNPKGFHIGNGGSFGRLARLECYGVQQETPKVIIGARCSFGDLTHIACVQSIQIGDDCLFASKVLLVDFSHGNVSSDRDKHPSDRPLLSRAGIVIGNNVWVCEGVTIYSGARIPDGAIVPAHSFVDHKFTNYR